jgi:hypothetical protein
MPIALMLVLTTTMVATAFVSGIFGMAGGLILIGVLLALLPVPEAMALHAVTQMASNGWRALLWVRYVRWPATLPFLMGLGTGPDPYLQRLLAIGTQRRVHLAALPFGGRPGSLGPGLAAALCLFWGVRGGAMTG